MAGALEGNVFYGPKAEVRLVYATVEVDRILISLSIAHIYFCSGTSRAAESEVPHRGKKYLWL